MKSSKKSFFTGLSWVFVLLFIPSVTCLAAAKKETLQLFTGTHTRIAWVQEQGNGVDTFCFGNNFKLMGYDSLDGKGERALLSEISNYYKPIFTPDGEHVVVSSRISHEIYLVSFTDGQKRLLGMGVAVDVWQDPQTDIDWVYALAGVGPENKYFTTHPLVRFQIQSPGKQEVVWSKTPLSWSNLDFSRDGKFAGGLFPWPNAGIFIVKENAWKKYGKGCWTALSPDNSAILWVFDGLHRNLNFVDPFTAKFWSTNINNAPGIQGYEVYHPRWSNHVRYFSMTGPYVEGEGGNKITGGGQKVEIYIGRFSPDLTSVEKWYQLTHNEKADFYPDVWLANGKESNFRQDSPEKTRILPESTGVVWPAASSQLLFLWQDSMAENRLDEKSLVGFSQFKVTPKRRARFNRFLEMDLQENGFIASWPASKALAAAKKLGGISFEFLFTPSSIAGAGDISGSVLRLEDRKTHSAFGFAQSGKDVVVEIFQDNKQKQRLIVTNVLQPDIPKLFVITLKGNGLHLYANGRLLKQISLDDDLLATLQNVDLIFGSQNQSSPGINGSLSHIAVYAGSVSEDVISQNARMITGSLESRKAIENIRFKGKLLEISKVPDPDSLGAYQRALVVNRYQILNLHKGKYTDKEILVAQWAVLERKILPETKTFENGIIHELHVEKFDQHPELEGERLMMDMFDPDLDIYYQVDQ